MFWQYKKKRTCAVLFILDDLEKPSNLNWSIWETIITKLKQKAKEKAESFWALLLHK